MTAKTRTQLALLFENTDIPTASGFQDLFDSFLNLSDTAAQTINSPLTLGGLFTASAGAVFYATAQYSQRVQYDGNVTFNSSASFADTVSFSVESSASATGTTQGTALGITKTITVIKGGTAAQGVIVPANVGAIYSLYNRTTNNVFAYPASGAAVNGFVANAPFTVSGSSAVDFVYTEATQAFTFRGA